MNEENPPKKKIKLGRRINDKKTVDLFRNVVYAIDDSLRESQKIRLRNLLRNNGAKPEGSFYETEEMPEDLIPNLYISAHRLYPFSSYENVESVTPLWVEKAVSNGFVHDVSNYSPVLNQFLSGMAILILDLPDDSRDAITNEVQRFGGLVRHDITTDLTHLICVDPRGAQYNQCIELKIPVVLPQWLDECFRYWKKTSIDLFRFPNPIVYYENNPTPAKLHPYHDTELISGGGDHNLVLEDEVIYFGKDINIKEDFKIVLEEAIVRAGGTISEHYSHQEVTIVILKDRATAECRMASKDQKLIASLWWVTNTLSRGHYNSPLSTLLDYPTPPGGLPGMENNVIAIAGYGNVTRYYLRRLVTALGARYDPAINSKTTHLICGRAVSNKYTKAKEFTGITIVNHLWLEDCYQLWEAMDCAGDSRYVFIPMEKPILDACAGRTNLLVAELERWMDTSTLPPCYSSHYRFPVQSNNSTEEEGSVNIRQRRQAAIKATQVLNDIVMPDANAYERERSR
ncbi:hypothetical protein MFLAVUS_006420 [Mucor flavus]|uniref:BRCT domain-containing protein n=1 Tax=Mucor flavus TaxID=439312 RepID=A0ABP9Z1H2_9FUNG